MRSSRRGVSWSARTWRSWRWILRRIEQILAEPVAARAGFAGLVLACEPARHRWEPLAVTALAKPIFDCGQPAGRNRHRWSVRKLAKRPSGAMRIRNIMPPATAPDG